MIARSPPDSQAARPAASSSRRSNASFGSAGFQPARGHNVARTNGLDRAGSAGFLAGSWSKRSAYQRPRAQPVAHAPGKRWERRLEAGSWAQPTRGRFAYSWGLRPPGRLEAGAPSTIEVVPIRRNMAQRHRYFVVTAIVPAYPCAGDRLRPSKKRIEKQIQGLGVVGEPPNAWYRGISKEPRRGCLPLPSRD